MTPPGVQNERTSLAWVRTALGLAGCALLTGRLAITRGAPWAVVAALAAATLSVGVLGWAHDRYRRPPPPAVTVVPALVLTLAVVAVGALSLLLILV